jgi:molybdopterin/thiamine biosynthesis adenylyltransferase
MLTRNEKEQLDKAFTSGGLEETSCIKLQQAARRLKIPLRKVEWFLLEKGIVPPHYQYNIGSFGIAGQMTLLKSSAIIVGLGGLGGYVAENLARSGAGRIVGIDPDTFEESNLNRQLISDSESMGRKKTQKAKERIEKINPAVEFTEYTSSFDKVGDEIFRSVDLVFDCLDNVPDRLQLEKRCALTNRIMIHGAIAGWFVQVGIIWPGTEMLDKIYKNQNKGVEQNIGNLPFTAAFAASLMVAKGIKVLLGKSIDKKQNVIFYDLLHQDSQFIYLE